jgi:hypothetical protein
MNDGDSKNSKQIKKQRFKTNFIQRYISNVSDVLSPIWVRRFIQVNNGYEWFILGSRYRFLFHFRMFLVILYITYTALK